ncbi:MAG: ABC transporter ATP-binding protein [Alphaproteobacteria bacterium]
MSELIIKNLTHSYEDISVLHDINFTAPSGSITCVLGASGSGKTTLLRLVGGFECLQQGKIMVDNHMVASSDDDVFVTPEKRKFGMMFQDYALFPHMSVKQNLLFGLNKNNHERIAWVMDAAERLGLKKLLNKHPYELSGGEQQRTALLRAIAPEPKLLLLDEPFSGLDPHLRRQTRDEVISFIRNVGITTMVVTHDPEEASYMGDQLLILDNGILCQKGTPFDVRSQPKTPMVARFFGAVNAMTVKVKESRVALPVLKEELDIPNDYTRVTLQFYPENLRVVEGDDFTLKQRFMVEYGGERMILEHNETKQRFIAYCGSVCPFKIGEQAGLSIEASDILIFEAS